MKETFDKDNFEPIGSSTEVPPFVEQMTDREDQALDGFKKKPGLMGKMARAFALSSLLITAMPQEGYGKDIHESNGSKQDVEESFSKHENFSFKHGSLTFTFNSDNKIEGVSMRGFKTGMTREMLTQSLFKEDWIENITVDKSSIESEPVMILQLVSTRLRMIDLYKDGYEEIVSKKGEDSEEALFLKKVMGQTIKGIEHRYGPIFREDLF